MKTPLFFDLGRLDEYIKYINFDGYFGYARYSAVGDFGDFSINYVYYKDRSFNFNFLINQDDRGLNSDISPDSGRDIEFKFSRHYSRYFIGFEVNSDFGTLQEDYREYDYNHFDMLWRERFSLPMETGLTTLFKGTYLDRKKIASFYDNYIGGLSGLRGYSFYSVGGTRTIFGSATLRFPVLKRMDVDMGFFNFKKMYAGVFAEAGLAWTGEDDDKLDMDIGEYFDKNLRKDFGVNLRIYGISFYGMPTAIDYSVAYGIDEFILEDVKYGKEFRQYLTVLFNFPEF